MIASASGASSTSMTPLRTSRPSRRLCSRQVSMSGAGSVATARPRTLAGRRASGRTVTAGGVADLLGRRRLAFPQRLIGLRVGQIQRERCAVVDRDRPAQRQAEQVEEVAARSVWIQVRGVVSRAWDAGGDQRRAVAEARGETARASCASRRGTSGSIRQYRRGRSRMIQQAGRRFCAGSRSGSPFLCVSRSFRGRRERR